MAVTQASRSTARDCHTDSARPTASWVLPDGPAQSGALAAGRPRPAVPRRAVRPKTAAEKESCAAGPAAEAFITGAAAAGHTRLGPELAGLNTLRAAHGEQAFAGALDRAVASGRWRAADVRSILAAGAGIADPRPAGDVLALDLPAVPVRPLADYAIGALP